MQHVFGSVGCDACGAQHLFGVFSVQIFVDSVGLDDFSVYLTFDMPGRQYFFGSIGFDSSGAQQLFDVLGGQHFFDNISLHR